MAAQPVYVFPPFRLAPDERMLTAGGLPLKLGGRAFDTLLALVERRERTVSKNELLDIVWPRLVVEENNLQVQVVTLRKLLGHHAIATVPGRGYRFTMPVAHEDGPPAPAAAAAAAAQPGAAAPSPAHATALPVPPGIPNADDDLFGRERELVEAGALLRERRVVSIVGAGGIGKTRLAQAAAAAARADFADGVWWVELASITDPALVPTAVARSLGLSLDGGRDALQSVVSRLGERSMLIVLDNCEHLLDGVVEFVDAAILAAPRLHLLVTSQEVLKANGEQVFRLGTLGVAANADVAQVAGSGAGALLLARIRGAMPHFELTAANAAAAAEICRRLDGIPLAIELAAARVPLLGIEGVRAKLDERFRMLTAGARVVLRRHQTLRAALEWSHGLLTEEERVVFRRLGVFAGGFTLESAQRVADDDDIDAWAVLEHLGALVDKSLVLAEGESVPRYRMLETTRLYALEQLAAAEEVPEATRKHAQAIKTLLAVFETPARWWRSTPVDFTAAATEVDNMRVALDWAEQQPSLAAECLDLASASLYAFVAANIAGEGFRRLLSFERLARGDVADDVLARYFLALARMGTQMAAPEALSAALRAADLYAALGNAEREYTARVCALAIAARTDAGADGEALMARVAVLEPQVSQPRLLGYCEWARHRWLLRQGRPEEALAHAWRQFELTQASGATHVVHVVTGANVAYCELALGRVDVAEARARAALGALDADLGAGHALDTWSMALAMQGKLDEALVIARRAHVDLNASGDAFMLLDGLAMIAAEQGRLRDAAITAARSDIEFEQRSFHRWPLSREWRRRASARLAAVPAERLAQWQREAAGMPAEAALLHALGRAALAEEGVASAG